LFGPVVHDDPVFGDGYKFVADFVIDGLVDIEPFDGEADLA
jgi:hypothetical protein